VIPNCRVLALNSCLLRDASAAPAEAAAQMAWLDEMLIQGPTDKTTLIIQHHPMFIDDEEETGESLLASKSKSHYKGYIMSNEYFHLPRPMRQIFLDKLHKSAGHVTAVLTGHFHQNWHRQTRGIQQITTASVSATLGKVHADTGECLPPADKPGFRVFKMFPAGPETILTSRYYPVETGMAEAWRNLGPNFVALRQHTADEWW
jgi:hypothetical protein